MVSVEIDGCSGRTQRRMAELVRPRLLDLFCGAGGAGMGYHRAEPAPCRCELAVTWPDRATDDIFNAAIAFAFAVQNGRRDARNAR